MWPPNIFNMTTVRWLLEVIGFLILLVACWLHSWNWDAAGLGVLLLAQVTNLPPGASGFKATLAAILLSLTPAPRLVPAQYSLPFDKPAPLHCTWAVTPCGRRTTIRAWADTH